MKENQNMYCATALITLRETNKEPWHWKMGKGSYGSQKRDRKEKSHQKHKIQKMIKTSK